MARSDELEVLARRAAGGDLASAQRLVERLGGSIQDPHRWVVVHSQHRGGRGRDSNHVVRMLLLGCYSSVERAYEVAAERAKSDSWKLRNDEARRAFRRAEVDGDHRRMVDAYSTGSDYTLEVVGLLTDDRPFARGGFDSGDWSL